MGKNKSENRVSLMPDDGVRFTIDELAAESGVASRTIRFYQSKGVLSAPERCGRVAQYGRVHVDQLRKIGELKDKGLTIRAIRDLMARIARGEILYSEWLGFEEEIESPWIDDAAQVFDKDALEAKLGDRRKGLVADLEELGTIERRGNQWFVPSLSRLNIVLGLEKVGIGLSTCKGAGDVLEKHMGRAAKEVVDLFSKDLSGRLGQINSPDDVSSALATLKSLGISAVSLMFAQAVQEELIKAVQSGKATLGGSVKK